MQIVTNFMGVEATVEVDESRCFTMQPPLAPFEGLSRYALVPEDGSVVEWLQSLEEPSVCFALLDPFAFYPEYAFDLSDHDAQLLGIESPEDVAVRVILTLREQAEEITANLLAPVVFCRRTGLARQVVLLDADLPVRAPVLAAVEAAEAAEAPVTTARRAA